MCNMGWKQRLGVDGDSLISKEVDEYLKENGFKESTMSPRFVNSTSLHHKIIKKEAQCLRLIVGDPSNSNNKLTIFINRQEVYMEVEDRGGKFFRSYHEKIDSSSDLDIEWVDKILDKVSKQ